MVSPGPPEFESWVEQPVHPIQFLSILRDTYYQFPEKVGKAKIKSVKHLKLAGKLPHEFVLVAISHDDHPGWCIHIRIDHFGDKKKEQMAETDCHPLNLLKHSKPSISPDTIQVIKAHSRFLPVADKELSFDFPPTHTFPLWRLGVFLKFLSVWPPSYELMDSNCYYYIRMIFAFLAEKAGKPLSDIQATMSKSTAASFGTFWEIPIFKKQNILPADLTELLDISERDFLKMVNGVVDERNEVVNERNARITAEQETERLRAELAAFKEASSPASSNMA